MAEKNPIVTIEMNNGDIMKAELYPEIAPNTVNNFISLVNKGFYDGVIFHRVIRGFMIQGGDPQGTGVGGPGYSIKGEFSGNGFANDLKHTPGVLSMARTMMPDSAGEFVSSFADLLKSMYQQQVYISKLKEQETVDRIPLYLDDYESKCRKMVEKLGIFDMRDKLEHLDHEMAQKCVTDSLKNSVCLTRVTKNE